MDKDGIVLIDVDAMGFAPKRPLTYFGCLEQFKSHLKDSGYTALSVNHIRGMIDIYQKMLLKPLPRYHEAHHMEPKLFYSTLELYILICRNTLDALKVKFPNLVDKTPNKVVPEVLSHFIEKIEEAFKFYRDQGKLQTAKAFNFKRSL